MSEPQLFLAAQPRSAVEMRDLLRSDSELSRLLDEGQRLRPDGFDLCFRGASRIVNGKVRRKVSPGHKLLQISMDGNIMFLAAGDGWFLCWPGSSGRLRINPFVLAEVTYNFVLFSQRAMRLARPVPHRLRFFLHLQNMQNEAGLATLTPTRVDPGWVSLEEPSTAPEPDYARNVDASLDDPPGRIAFDLVEGVYAWFGIGSERIPYARLSTDGGIIDETTIFGKKGSSD